MKKILAIFVMVLFAAYPAVSQAAKKGHGAPVEVSGVIVLQHIMSEDAFDTTGDDQTDAYKIYLNFDKQITSGIKTHITVNADKFGEGDSHADDEADTAATDSAALEEAYVMFTGIGGNDIAAIFGKMEAPYGQDYSQFISSTYTHHYLEVDKVWGACLVFGIDNIGSLTVATAQSDARDRGADTALTETYAAKIKADKLIDNASIEASMINIGATDAEGDDEVRTSIAGKYTMGDLTIAAEQSKVDSEGFDSTHDTTSALLLSADYRIGNILLKANVENISDDHFGHDSPYENVTMYGANYDLADGVYATIEAKSTEFEDKTYDADQILLGLYAHF